MTLMHFIFGLPYLLVVTRFILPLQIPLIAKICAAVFLLVGSQMHLWNKLSSDRCFRPSIHGCWSFCSIGLLELRFFWRCFN